MNTKKFLVLSGLLLVFLSFSSFKSQSDLDTNMITIEDQDGLVVYATYAGKEDWGYDFVTTDKEGMEHTLTFQNVEDAVLAAFDLNSDTFVGTKFKITFNRDIEYSKDEDDMEDQDETNTIINLEKL